MQFVQTEMGLKVDSKFVDMMGGFVPMEMVVKGMGYVLYFQWSFIRSGYMCQINTVLYFYSTRLVTFSSPLHISFNYKKDAR